MKRILPILLAMLTLSACTDSMHRGKVLKEAEALLISRPEEALRMLDSIGKEEGGMGKAERMRWQLLRLTAQNKCYVPFTSDSAAREVAAYFDRHGSPNERMAAHYQLGNAYRDMGEAPSALHCYQEAVDCADTTDADCDNWNLCRVYFQMSPLYNYSNMPQEEMDALVEAGKAAVKA